MDTAVRATHVKDVPLSFPQISEPFKGVGGPCDTSGEKNRNQLQEWRYSCLLLTFTAGSIAAGTTLRAFAEGVGDVGPQAGWGGTIQLSQAQTNLFPAGSLNNAKDGGFVGRTVGFAIGRPFVYTPATGARAYSETTDKYAARAARVIAENAEMSLFQRDDNLALYLGLPFMWPGAQQIVECAFPTFDKALGASILMPLRRDYEFIDDNKGNNSFIDLEFASALTLTSDSAEPVPASYSVPLWCMVYGDVISVSASCDIQKGSSDDPVAQVERLIGLGYTRDAAMQFVMQAGKR
jgi:hypothetical protein